MCQFDSRDPVGEHRPGTKCQYSGRIAGGPWPSAPASSRTPPPRLPPRPTPAHPTLAPRTTTGRPTPRGTSSVQTKQASAGTTRSSTPTVRRYRRPAAATGASMLDLFLLAVVVASWDRYYGWLGGWGVAIAVALVLAPFVVAFWLSSTCTAWNGTVATRCAHPRGQLLQRCHEPEHSHATQILTAPEIGALLSLLAGIAGLALLLFGR